MEYTTQQIMDVFSQISIERITHEKNEKNGIVQISVNLRDLDAARLKYLQAQQEVPPEHANKIGHTLDKLGMFLRDALGPVWETPAQYNKSLHTNTNPDANSTEPGQQS